MTPDEIRKLERTLEEHGIDCDTRMAIIEAAQTHNIFYTSSKPSPICIPPGATTLSYLF